MKVIGGFFGFVFRFFTSIFRMIIVACIMTGLVTLVMNNLTAREFGYLNMVIISSTYVFFTSFPAFLLEFLLLSRRKQKRREKRLARLAEASA